MKKYVVIDLEMCMVDKAARTKEYPWSREMIQIGAVLLNDAYEITDRFSTYVHPEHGTITRFIQNLTGISKRDTQNAPLAKNALAALSEWIPEEALLVSWSNNDLVQIRREMEYKQIVNSKMSGFFEQWIDCQKEFAEKMSVSKKYRLSEALTISDIYYNEAIHDGLVDAENTALLFAKIRQEEQLTLNPHYRNADMVEESTYNPFAELFAGLCIA